MKNGRYSDAQIMDILKQAEGGVPVSELCREHGMSSAQENSYVKLSLKSATHSSSRFLKSNRTIERMGFLARNACGQLNRIAPGFLRK